MSLRFPRRSRAQTVGVLNLDAGETSSAGAGKLGDNWRVFSVTLFCAMTFIFDLFDQILQWAAIA